MATQKQIAANQRNAQKSTGPKSISGKERSRANALKHGFTATTLFHALRGEDAGEFALIRAQLITDWNPVGTKEMLAVEMMANAFHRAKRIDGIEAGFFDGAMAAVQLAHHRPVEATDHEGLGCAIVLGDKEHQLTWDNLDRYRSHAWRDYNRSVEQLRRLQKDRRERPYREHLAFLAEQRYFKATRVPPVPIDHPNPPTGLVSADPEKLASFRLQNPHLFDDSEEYESRLAEIDRLRRPDLRPDGPEAPPKAA